MKNKLISVFASFLLSACLLSAVSANVGVGMSPSKVVIQIEGGKSMDYSFLVFNSGDNPLIIGLEASGDIAEFTTIAENGFLVEPEPLPHALPIKNGRTISVKFSPPATGMKTTITGMITAAGSAPKDAQFGGNVAVATPVEIIVTPSASVLSYITPQYWGLALLVIAVIAILFLLKKAGIKISIERTGR